MKNYLLLLKPIIVQYPNLNAILQAIQQAGGRPILVGGAVRDLLLDRAIKDLDIEVYNVTLEQLQLVLEEFGSVILVGKSFGVLKMVGLSIDWSLPRSDSSGRKPTVQTDPQMSFEKAFARRDLTMNAMGIDLLSGELIDPFDGLHDIAAKQLRTPNAQLFVEDPLRLFRVMQFIGRFDMYPDDELNRLCASMDISSVSRERIELECEKLLLQSNAPSKGLRWLYDIGRLQEIVPELAATKGVQQNPQWHPEGDVFEHTMQAVDAMALLVGEYDDTQKLILLYAALCHDLGKAVSTTKLHGKITSHGHEETGVALARSLLKRITHKQDIIAAVLKLVRYHMAPLQFVSGDARLSRYKRLARLLEPECTLAMIVDLVRADRRGRNGQGHEPLKTDDSDILLFIDNVKKAGVMHHAEEPLLQGKDLLEIIPPGMLLGKALSKAYEIQIDESIIDKEFLKQRILALFKKNEL